MKTIRKICNSVILLNLLLGLLACEAQKGQRLESPTVPNSISIGDLELVFVNVRLRESIQQYYRMLYPDPGYTFLEVELAIEGLDIPPESIETWGSENLLLSCDGKELDMAFTHRVIEDDHVEYKVGEPLNFHYVYTFQVLQNLANQSCVFGFLDGPQVDLAPLLKKSDDQTASSPPKNLGTVLSGQENRASGENAVIGGGSQNSANAVYTTVGGGVLNTADHSHSTVCGGRENAAAGFYATIGGGYANMAAARDTFIGGGSRNVAEAPRAVVGGGLQNQASGPDSTIAGGAYNQAKEDYAAICGGTRNKADGYASTIGGGAGNLVNHDQATVAGGLGNQVDGKYGFVGGGYGNLIAGDYGTIPGGSENQANAAYSFAAGQKAIVVAEHSGAFVFADASNVAFKSVAANEFAVRATGGVRLVSAVGGDGNIAAGVQLPPGSGSWATLSDRNAKSTFLPVDRQATLTALAEMPITTWQYETQASSIRHMGPTAQDFYHAFGLGEGQRYINTVDADGVALASIQGLYVLVQTQHAQFEEQNLRTAEIEARLESLEQNICQNSKNQSGFVLWLGIWGTGFLSACLWMHLRCYISGLSSRKP